MQIRCSCNGERQDIASCRGERRVSQVLLGPRSMYLRSVPSDGPIIAYETENYWKGVNTGFGGSADTRTDEVDKLQRTLISFLNCGVLAVRKESHLSTNGHVHEPTNGFSNGLTNGFINGEMNGNSHGSQRSSRINAQFKKALLNEDPMASTLMPESWVKSSLLVRGNSLACGNSAVRPELIQNLVGLLRKDIIPVIPVRGSVSASGDLIPLSYIGGALEGSPGIQVWVNDNKGGRKITTADVALSQSSLAPLRLAPKEGLAIVNGTAVSAGIGTLALHDAHCLAVLSQILTSMSVESLRGCAESFDPFLAAVRPHMGQIEASHNIQSFLTGSKLITTGDHHSVDDGSLRQDRYSTRTAPQWLGPQLEDLMLAHKQLSVEINSSTDNPIIDSKGGRVLHGGNFQAMSVTSAMEKARSAMQAIGRMLFAQCTELINPALNNGLPPNLTADEPSQSFLLKGVDISIAALQAELGLLANPIQSHMQNAEMGNQSLNSLALVSARYTHMALDVLSQLSAAFLLTLCQALDLRVLHIRFLDALEPALASVTYEIFAPVLHNVDRLHAGLWLHFERELNRTTTMDSAERFPQVIGSMQTTILAHALHSSKDDASLLPALRQWTERCCALALETFRTSRDVYAANPDPTGFLGSASNRMYKFVRQELGVPFQTAFSKASNPDATWMDPSTNSATIGSLVTKVYTAIRSGALYVPVMECLREVCSDAKDSSSGTKRQRFST